MGQLSRTWSIVLVIPNRTESSDVCRTGVRNPSPGFMLLTVAAPDMESIESVSLEVVQAVAEYEGVDPLSLEPPLHHVIDTDALDSLFESTGGKSLQSGSVEFTYRGHHVRVDSTGDVTVGDSLLSPEPGRHLTRDQSRS